MKPKNTHFLCFGEYSFQASMYKKSEYFFHQEPIDWKCLYGGRAEIEILNVQKVTSSNWPLPSDGTFILLLYISCLLNIAQKGIIQILDT